MPDQEKRSRTQYSTQGKAIFQPINRLEDDATGINVDDRQPIDPRMPHMPPA